MKKMLPVAVGLILCGSALLWAEKVDENIALRKDLLKQKGLAAESLRSQDVAEGRPPKDFRQRTGAEYKPSYNPEPSIPAQCWIETGYGTQNACLYCHTDYLNSIKHGNAFPLGEDQILFSFPSRELNKVLWRNTIFPEEIGARLRQENIAVPNADDVVYVRQENWKPAFDRARADSSTEPINAAGADMVLFPALNPEHLYPGRANDPTASQTRGFIDQAGFVRGEKGELTGWRAINFFPYGIFTPLSGSVSGVYIRLPSEFRNVNGKTDQGMYQKNLELLERNIKNRTVPETTYFGDASGTPVVRGFFPVGTEFAHPLHYVDVNADGQVGRKLDGLAHDGEGFEFPGTRARRLKEMRYMYKWREVAWQDIGEAAHEGEVIIGNDRQGWVDNNAGWLLSGFIEDRQGNLRAQTSEEMMQCMGCHGKVGNTVDSVWSFPRKLPGEAGWREMDYGAYDSRNPERSRLVEYFHGSNGMGEMGFFYHAVTGADLYGIMPPEVAGKLMEFARTASASLDLKNDVATIFSDEKLKSMGHDERKSHLYDRQRIMRAYVALFAYLEQPDRDGPFFIKGSLLYPSVTTMKNNIQLYRKIVLDQSFNLGKDVFGTEPGHVPFTFRSDGMVRNAEGRLIPVGEIILSRPSNEAGEGITPTGIVKVNEKGKPVDVDGNEVDLEKNPEKAVGHVSTGGTFDTMYNPILDDRPLK